MRSLLLTLPLLLVGCAAPGSSTAPNLDADRLALDGFDPTTYFEGDPRRGDAALALEHDGAVYRFVDAEHRARFEADPERFVPEYGGWCAWAVSEGYTYEVDPESYLIQDDRLLLFYDGTFGDTRALWLEDDADARLDAADANWVALGEAEAE